MKESFHHFSMNNYGKPRNEWRFADQERPEPSPGHPRPIPRAVRANATPSDKLAQQIVDAGKRARGEIQWEGDAKGLAKQIVDAGAKRRGELDNDDGPKGLADRIIAAGRKRRGDDR